MKDQFRARRVALWLNLVLYSWTVLCCTVDNFADPGPGEVWQAGGGRAGGRRDGDPGRGTGLPHLQVCTVHTVLSLLQNYSTPYHSGLKQGSQDTGY